MTALHRSYSLAVSDPRPAMTVTHTHVVCDDYEEAVAAAHTMHRITGRSVYLFSAGETGTPSTYYWHRVVNGEFVDRNTNSGVPESGRI